MVVTIDGPAASGKSTTARRLARLLGWMYLDTGAMYRAMTVKVLDHHIPLEDTEAISRLAETTEINLISTSNETRVWIDGIDRTDEIRNPAVDRAVGPVCEVPRVRELMVGFQRRLAEKRCLIAEGRDMGTVVFPGADLKFFMVASVEERTQRRQKDMLKQNIQISLKELEAEIRKRDERDSRRSQSPLKPAEDAVLVDTTRLTPEEQVDLILKHIQNITAGMEHSGPK
ncbi:MAG TPA: (d)CMP kinase [bacterium]|nr:(d)CMP kinase [bacterium]